MTTSTTVLVPHVDGITRYERDVSGWAYPHGFTVVWFPTKGLAKKSHFEASRRDPGFVGKIIPTTANEAAEWAQKHNPAGQWGCA